MFGLYALQNDHYIKPKCQLNLCQEGGQVMILYCMPSLSSNTSSFVLSSLVVFFLRNCHTHLLRPHGHAHKKVQVTLPPRLTPVHIQSFITTPEPQTTQRTQRPSRLEIVTDRPNFRTSFR
jgi:hypothetical protein